MLRNFIELRWVGEEPGSRPLEHFRNSQKRSSSANESNLDIGSPLSFRSLGGLHEGGLDHFIVRLDQYLCFEPEASALRRSFGLFRWITKIQQ